MERITMAVMMRVTVMIIMRRLVTSGHLMTSVTNWKSAKSPPAPRIVWSFTWGEENKKKKEERRRRRGGGEEEEEKRERRRRRKEEERRPLAP